VNLCTRHRFDQRRFREQRILDNRYPRAIAPTINTTKTVATAIAIFASTDKFIILPSTLAFIRITAISNILLFDRFEFQRTYGWQAKLGVSR
jgi:hypothetical protein